MPALTKQQLDSAQELAAASIAALKSEAGIHPGTVIAATARMAGTYLFRSFHLQLSDIQPGQAVLSDEANAKFPILIETAARLLSRIGITLQSAPSGLPTPPKDQPTLGFLETQRILEPAFHPIRTRYEFTSEQAAYAAAAATALLISHCAKALDPNIAFSIATLGFVEGTKIAPDPVNERDDSD